MRQVSTSSRRECARVLQAAMSNSDILRRVGKGARSAPCPRCKLSNVSSAWASLRSAHPTKRKGSGTPADALSSVPHQRVRSRHGKIGLRRPVRCRARSPAGVPPRLLPRRVSHPQGATRAMLRGRQRPRGGLHAADPAPTSSDAPRAPVIVPAGLMPEPPGSAADEATPAGTALAPLRPASPGRRPLGQVLIL